MKNKRNRKILDYYYHYYFSTFDRYSARDILKGISIWIAGSFQRSKYKTNMGIIQWMK